jgi:PAS domain S-box-containing protein
MGDTKINKDKNKNAAEISSDELEQLEMYIDELSRFLPLPFCTVNPSNMILNINKAFTDLTGWSDLEIIGEPIDRLFKNKIEAEMLEEKVTKVNLVKGEGMTLVTKNGQSIDASVSVSLRKDVENNIIGYFFAFSDISELKKLQRELEKKVEERTRQLEEKIEEMERFNRVAVGRELKMVELKQEIENLKSQLARMKKG